MHAFKLPCALAALVVVGACAAPVEPGSAPPANAGEHAGHRAGAGASPGMPERMKAMREMREMREMRDQMMNAKTPEQRQALMREHMKAMQDGMKMMKGMGEASATGAGHDHSAMQARMEMMQTMMEMMLQRLPATPGSAPAR